MRGTRAGLAAIAGTILALSVSVHDASPQDSGIRWLTNRKKAFEESRRTGKPLWVLFR